MRKRYILPIIFAVACRGSRISLQQRGVGHDWRTGALVILSLPLGSLSLLLEWLFPNTGLILLLPLFGFLQYAFIGYLVGSRLDERSVTANSSKMHRF